MSKFLSRKFILSILFVVVVCINYWVSVANQIPWEGILAMAGMLGLTNYAFTKESGE